MKLLIKFSLVFILVQGTGMAVAAFLSHRFLEANARDQVIQQARLMMASIRAVRDYTTVQTSPLLSPLQTHARLFLPQTVPAYAATESFNLLRRGFPDYSYKEATLNPTNPRDRAVEWEADLIRSFRDDASKKQMVGEHDAFGGRTLFLAQPIKADQPCLQCHDTASTAPAALVRRYGPDNGFGWKSGEVIGAQILLVPMAYPQQLARNAFASLLVYLAGNFVLSLVLLDVLLYFTIVRPASKMSRIAEEISKGNLDEAGLVVRGNDEISILARSFNRMQISLTHAMRMLEDHPQQDSVHPS